MYAYKFVQTQLGSFFQESTYRKTIEEYAKQGWLSASIADCL